MGFTHFDTLPTKVVPTVEEEINAMSFEVKEKILDYFARDEKNQTVRYKLFVSEGASGYLYKMLREINVYAAQLMRGEVIETPAEIDPETGEIVTPPVYNTPPNTIGQLRSAILVKFNHVYNAADINVIVNRLVADSKHKGTGNWTFYKNNVIL